ncbi:MAG: single-stranded DNA-binding protein [Oscillospiraceae bacterium]|nr:single-stranded DNA-binding protein [Oscillospiraceae bacterium]
MNVVALVGRLTADPELRQTPQGVAVATFTVAVDRPYSSKNTNERQADFINCVAWRNTAEFLSKYFNKGKLISVEGSIQTRTYDDKEGKKRYVTEILASNVGFVGSKAENGGGNFAAAPAQNNNYAPQQPAAYTNGSVEDFAIIDDNEDLPF